MSDTKFCRIPLKFTYFHTVSSSKFIALSNKASRLSVAARLVLEIVVHIGDTYMAIKKNA